MRHRVATRRHGLLDVEVEQVAEGDGYGRSWRATLVARPARLAHLVAVWADSEDDLPARVRAAADRYGNEPVALRWS